MDPAKTVIVIRSLVPEGVAERDGRLLPGDRLMFVNSTNLDNASLEEAVQALKGANIGMVHIGVAKPLPVREPYCDFCPKERLVCVYLCVCVRGGGGGAMCSVCVCVCYMYVSVCVCVFSLVCGHPIMRAHLTDGLYYSC